MRGLKQAIQQTIQYSQSFGLVPDIQTIHRYLISPSLYSIQTVAKICPIPTIKQQKTIRLKQKISKIKIDKATKIANLLSKIPTIKLICATGSIAIDNAKPDADLDLFIVTANNALWLTRPIVFVLLKTLRLRRTTKLPEHNSKKVKDKVCDNLWIDESALEIPESKRNLYTAHEVLQAKPLFDRGDYYQKFIHANSWTKKYLANAYSHSCGGRNPSSLSSRVSLLSSRAQSRDPFVILANAGIHLLNKIFFFLQYLYMKPKITNETITLHSAFFHPNSPPPYYT